MPDEAMGAAPHLTSAGLATGRVPVEWEIYMRQVLDRLHDVEMGGGGGGTGGGPSYLHTQSAPSDTWTIEHNFQTDYDFDGFPIVNVIASDGQQIIAEVHYQDHNTVVINFAEPETGYAYLRG